MAIFFIGLYLDWDPSRAQDESRFRWGWSCRSCSADPATETGNGLWRISATGIPTEQEILLETNSDLIRSTDWSRWCKRFPGEATTDSIFSDRILRQRISIRNEGRVSATRFRWDWSMTTATIFSRSECLRRILCRICCCSIRRGSETWSCFSCPHRHFCFVVAFYHWCCCCCCCCLKSSFSSETSAAEFWVCCFFCHF